MILIFIALNIYNFVTNVCGRLYIVYYALVIVI